MKLAFMISIVLILPIFAAYFITSPPQISEKSELSENVGVTEPNIDIKFAYSDRLLKATHEKALIADRVLGVKKLLKGETVEYDEKLYLR